MATVSTPLSAALHEERSLSDYYRQRNLYLAQTVLDLEAELFHVKAELEGLRPAVVPSETSEE